jgi:phage-related protein
MEWQIEFYEFTGGEKPVFNFIENLPTKDKAKVYFELELLEEYGIQLGPPRAIKIEGERYKGLWELRIKFSSNSYRIFYFLYTQKSFILLHANMKKKNKTSKNDLEISRQRMLDYKERFK